MTFWTGHNTDGVGAYWQRWGGVRWEEGAPFNIQQWCEAATEGSGEEGVWGHVGCGHRPGTLEGGGENNEPLLEFGLEMYSLEYGRG